MDPEAPKEIAKATGEVAKFGTAALEFLARITGAPLEQLSGLFADQVAFLRAKRQLRMKAALEDASAQLTARRIQATAVPDKVLVPLLEAASLEEDPELSKRWAMLLANAADPSTAASVSARYVRILADLTADEVSILELNYSKGLMKQGARAYFGEERDLFPENRVQLMSEHLTNLGLAQPELSGSSLARPFVHVAVGPGIVFTRTAVDFVAACHAPRVDSTPAASPETI